MGGVIKWVNLLVRSFCAELVAMDDIDVSLSLADEPRDNDEDDANDEDDDELVQADGDDGNEVDPADIQEIVRLEDAVRKRGHLMTPPQGSAVKQDLNVPRGLLNAPVSNQLNRFLPSQTHMQQIPLKNILGQTTSQFEF